MPPPNVRVTGRPEVEVALTAVLVPVDTFGEAVTVRLWPAFSITSVPSALPEWFASVGTTRTA